MQSLAQLDDELSSQDEKLAELEKQQRTELGLLEQARQQRSTVLASLMAESNSHAQSLERLKSQQAGLEKLLRELREADGKVSHRQSARPSRSCAANSHGRSAAPCWRAMARRARAG